MAVPMLRQQNTSGFPQQNNACLAITRSAMSAGTSLAMPMVITQKRLGDASATVEGMQQLLLVKRRRSYVKGFR
jgi:hypothetical protein